MEKIKIYDENLNEILIKSDGKLVVLNLWAIWCGYCKEELQNFEEIYNKYKNDIKLYMVCCIKDKSEAESVVKYIKEKGYTFDVFFDLKDNLTLRYNAIGFPTTVFIDEDLNTLAKNVGALSREGIIDNIEKYK